MLCCWQILRWPFCVEEETMTENLVKIVEIDYHLFQLGIWITSFRSFILMRENSYLLILTFFILYFWVIHSFQGGMGLTAFSVCVWVIRLFVWVLWYINLCRLFNTKSIFMKIVLFQTIQFSIRAQFKCKYSSIGKNISISSYSVLSISSNSVNSI